jgi:predicted RNA polymerase sigma factor
MSPAAVEQVWREEWGRVLALLVAQYRRLDLAEDALADAFEAAARSWPADGVPVNPPAWLLTAARRRVVDGLRAEAIAVRRHRLLVVDAEVQQRAHAVLADPGGLLPDERLRLLLLCAHPSLAAESACALSLRLVLGVSTPDVARLFLTSTATMAARLTRAKRKLVVTGVPLADPDAAQLTQRVGVVASVAYLAFTAGYAPGSGPDPVRTDLASEGIRLARVALDLLPERPMLQAMIAAEHATAPTAADTRWDRIAATYAELEGLTGSAVVRLNRAVAVAEAEGPTAGLALLDEDLDARLPGSHRLPATRAVLLERQRRRATSPARRPGRARPGVTRQSALTATVSSSARSPRGWTSMSSSSSQLASWASSAASSAAVSSGASRSAYDASTCSAELRRSALRSTRPTRRSRSRNGRT